MPYELYKTAHIVAMLVLFLSLGGMVCGGRRKLCAIGHGLSLLVLLVSGFGLKAKLGMNAEWPGWIVAMLVAWVLAGAAMPMARRAPALAVVLLLVIGGVTSWAAVYKPF